MVIVGQECSCGTCLSFSLPPSVFSRRMHRLGASKITQVDFLPKEVVTYAKETQTPLAAHQSEGKYE